ncbi:hypothetical protein PG996_006711 [Apiospora saccharicola]|uniref:Uncharacterized protein n=1 Tax=Apiospora saccharicola TaxID=335842 RepID=A0ABR1V8S2_9PEZI
MYVPLLEDETTEVDSLRALLKAQCAQHANEVAKLERDLQEAHNFIHAQFGDMKRKHENEMRQTKAQHDAQYGELMQKYKTAGKQLAVAQSQTQGIFQDLTDDRLVQKALTLRQTVKTFAQLWRDLFIRVGKTPDVLRWSARETGPVSLDGHPLLLDKLPITPVSMQAYIWHTIVKSVFGKCVWAGDDAENLHHVWCRFNTYKKQDDVQALRKMKIWKATTASLLLGPTVPQIEMTSNVDADRQIHRQIRRICNHAFPGRLFVGFHEEVRYRYQMHVYQIIEQAVKLDLEVCKQGAGIHWEFGDVVGRMDNYDPETEATLSMRIITAPALLKLGKSNGEDLDLEPRVLLQGEEACAFEGSRLISKEGFGVGP